MPDLRKYPSEFNPNYFFHPGMCASPPSEDLETSVDLFSEENSYHILLSLDDIRRDYPTATHISLERISGRELSDDEIKATIQRRTQHPNLNYAAEMARYQDIQTVLAKAKAEWEVNCQRWKAEAEADYKVYLGLKARFEGR